MQNLLRLLVLLGLFYAVSASVEKTKPQPKPIQCVLNTKHPKKPSCTPAKYCFYDSTAHQCRLKTSITSTGFGVSPYNGTSTVWSAPTPTTNAADTTVAPTHTAIPVLLTPTAPLSNIQAAPTKAVYYGKSNSDADVVLAAQIELNAPGNFTLINGDDFASWIDSFTCSSSAISLVFTTPDAYEEAVTGWSQAGDLILVTSSASFCGSSDDHDFYNVLNITTSAPDYQITLSVNPMNMSALGGYTLNWGVFSKDASSDSSYNGSLTYDLVWSIANAANQSQNQNQSALARRDNYNSMTLLYMENTGTNWGIVWGDGNGNFIQCAYCGMSGAVLPSGTFSEGAGGVDEKWAMTISKPQVNVNWGFTVPGGNNIVISEINSQEGDMNQGQVQSGQTWYHVGSFLDVSPYWELDLALTFNTPHLISGGEFGYTQTLNDINIYFDGPPTDMLDSCYSAGNYPVTSTTFLTPDMDPSVGYFDSATPITFQFSLNERFGIWYGGMATSCGDGYNCFFTELDMNLATASYTLTPQPGNCASATGYGDYKSLGVTGNVSMSANWATWCEENPPPSDPIYTNAATVSKCYVW